MDTLDHVLPLNEVETGGWFESLMWEICARFIDLPVNQVDAAIERAQYLLCEGFGLDRSTLWQKSADQVGVLLLTHAYQPADQLEIKEAPDARFLSDSNWILQDSGTIPVPYRRMEGKVYFPWIFEQIERGKTVVIETLEDLPPAARCDREAFLRDGTKSTVIVPLSMGKAWLGCLSFTSTQFERNWSKEFVKRFELMGNLFTHALARKSSDLALRENAAKQQTIRKDAERSLQESEARFGVLADSAPVLIWMSDHDNQYFFFNKPWLDFTGRTLSQESGTGWAAGLHPEDVEGYLETCAAAFASRQSFVLQCRLRRHDGTYRWIANSGMPRFGKEGQFSGYIGSCVDVTERIEAEESARDMAGRLINAQEQERARLARELHDDVTQRLARLAIDAGRIERANLLGADTDHLIKGVREGLVRLSEDVHAMSYKLHPSAIIDLGLVDALKSECEQVSAREAITAKATFRNLPPAIPSDMAIGLFRIAQESLRNAARHGRASKATVSLWGVDDGLQLVVEDNGIGFDPNLRRNRPSLGLESMREQARLLGGTLFVESKPHFGATIVAWVPLTESIL